MTGMFAFSIFADVSRAANRSPPNVSRVIIDCELMFTSGALVVFSSALVLLAEREKNELLQCSYTAIGREAYC